MCFMKLIVHHVTHDYDEYDIVLKVLERSGPWVCGPLTLEVGGGLGIQARLTAHASSANDEWVTLSAKENPKLQPGDEVRVWPVDFDVSEYQFYGYAQEVT
jgi:hypothetical protein